MIKIKDLALEKKIIVSLVEFVLLTGLASIAPLFHYQPITGPIVNAILFIAVILLGMQNAVLVGLIPSVIALASGLLPAVFAPMIPFIMLGNTILVIVFGYLKDRNYWLGVILASVLKFVFLWATSSMVINLVLNKVIASGVAMMMSWPQLATALVGGLIAYIFLKNFKKI